MNSLIEFKNATLGYGTKVVLKDISFAIPPGDYFGLVGPNGAGKTTILRAILGALKPLAGDVFVQGPGGEAIRFGYVPQRDTIDYIMPYTVEEVVMMGRYHEIGMFGRPGKRDRDLVRQSLSHIAIENLRDRTFKDLSGGQKQRVLIARALSSEPDVLILDEPTNGMDLPSRISILDLINALHREGKLTVIMVSHLLDDVANHVKRIAIVEQNFFQVGDVDEVLTGENLSALYGMPVNVQTVQGNTMIIAGSNHGQH
jgi:manganese/zinc/iron transport system ATP- binding protein